MAFRTAHKKAPIKKKKGKKKKNSSLQINFPQQTYRQPHHFLFFSFWKILLQLPYRQKQNQQTAAATAAAERAAEERKKETPRKRSRANCSNSSMETSTQGAT
jgi:hypothetical protein